MKKIGVFIDLFNNKTIKREGFSRFLFYLIESLIKNNNYVFEIWSFPLNVEPISDFFSSLKLKYPNNIIYCPKKLKSRFSAFFYAFFLIGKIAFTSENIRSDIPHKMYRYYIKKSSFSIVNFFDKIVSSLIINPSSKILHGVSRRIKSLLNIKPTIFIANLANEANKSDANIFIIPVLGEQISLGLDKKQILILHDLSPFEFFDLFEKEFCASKKTLEEISFYINELNKKNTQFVTHCSYVKNTHINTFFPHISEKNIHVTLLPTLQPASDFNLINFDEIKSKFNISSPYIFYPTQNRPHKNFITLLKALKNIQQTYPCIKLIFTNSNSFFADEIEFINSNNLHDSIFCAKNLSDNELYSFYHYAEMTAVPTLFEGNFPLQAMESLFMNTPILLSKIPVTLERLKFHVCNFEKYLFDPLDDKRLSEKILHVLKNRQQVIADQMSLKEKIQSITWDNMATAYSTIINQI